MVTTGRPPNVSGRRLPGAAVALPGVAARPREEWLMVSGWVPWRLESCTRALVPAMVGCTTLRMVCPGKPRSVPGSAPEGEVDQEPTQLPAAAGAAERRASCGCAAGGPSLLPTPTNIAVETAITTAASAASTAYAAPRGRGDLFMGGCLLDMDGGAYGSGVRNRVGAAGRRRSPARSECGPMIPWGGALTGPGGRTSTRCRSVARQVRLVRRGELSGRSPSRSGRDNAHEDSRNGWCGWIGSKPSG
ncbi:hypothetical protein GCM10020000_51010 [Streptomyces olivoverticillatus]